MRISINFIKWLRKIVEVGSGPGGLMVAAEMRQLDYDGTVYLLDPED
jgi:hypothetical protein